MLYNILSIVALVCAIWVTYDVWTKQRMDMGKKLVWTILANCPKHHYSCHLLFNEEAISASVHQLNHHW